MGQGQWGRGLAIGALGWTAAAAPAGAAELASTGAADTAFLLVCTALVLLMTPGLAFFYAGLVRGKNVVNTLMLGFAAMALLSVQWVLWGYSLAFHPGHPWLGGLGWVGFSGVGMAPEPSLAPGIPHLAFGAFQMMFAIIAPALIAGAVVERVRFGGFVLFLLLWATFVYDPVAHWVWASEGWLRRLGALDFAGGTVVHVTAGVSGLVAALLLGRREGLGRDHTPHNVPLVLLGGALLWVGWFGFNAGSALGANGLAALALVNTHVAAAVGAVAWMGVEAWRTQRVGVAGALSGALGGLVAITPAAGYVGPLAALAIGVVGAWACQAAVRFLPRGRIDDALDTFAIHGVGGVVGALATGVWASQAINPAGANGLLAGGFGLLLWQGLGVTVVACYSALLTAILFWLVDRCVGLRVAPHLEAEGLDRALHGTPAYAFGAPEGGKVGQPSLVWSD